jgi:hypothetical protein
MASFKVQKLNIDLSLDLTEYVPGADGALDTVKKTPENLFAWSKMIAREADKLNDLTKGDVTNEAMITESQASMIRQIDWFYEKGEAFWNLIPFTALRDILEHLRGQVIPAQKK